MDKIQDLAFTILQNSMEHSEILAHFRRKCNCRICTICVANQEGLDAFLMQENNEEDWELLACASK